MKAYRNSKGYRNIPVGYSAADIAELRPMLQDFLTCGGNASDSVDFFALNSYEWCGDVDYNTSGYANLQAGAANFPVPIFFSETGCNTARPRTFEDQAAIFGEEMLNDWVCRPGPPPPRPLPLPNTYTDHILSQQQVELPYVATQSRDTVLLQHMFGAHRPRAMNKISGAARDALDKC